MSIDTAAAAKAADELKSPSTFNARKALNQTTYPVDTVDVYADARAAHHINILANDATKLRYNAQLIWDKARADALQYLTENQNAESDDPQVEAEKLADTAPGFAAANREATEAEQALADAIPALRATMLTFHLRGLAPKQWRTIHKLGRLEIKEPVRKHFEKGEDGDEEFQAAIVERNITRNAWINNSCIASAIVKVTNAEGEEDTGVWTVDDVDNVYDTYLESEYEKIKSLMETLTFANNIFQMAVQQDADFLPKR